MNFGKFLIQLVSVCAILVVLYFARAVRLPTLPSSIRLSIFPIDLIFLLLSLILLTLIGGSLGKGIRGVKGTFDAILLACLGALLIGGLLALMTYLHFPYSFYINLSWLGTRWYDPWITIFLVGAPLLLVLII
jgi:hypothetical protein